MGERGEHPEQAEPGKVQRGFHAAMSGRYWRVIAAIGIVACLSWPVLSQPIEVDPAEVNADANENREQDDETGNAEEQYGPELPPAIIALPSSPDHDRSSVVEVNTGKPTDYAEEDLKAQQSMALWARWMFWASAASAIAACIATVLVFLTLSATRKALRQTQTATDHTARTLDHAEATAAEARIATYRQQRAYLSIETIGGILGRISTTVDAGDVQIAVTVSIRNNGATPATAVSCSVKVSARAKGGATVFDENRDTSVSDVAPGQIVAHQFDFNTPWSEMWLGSGAAYYPGYSPIDIEGSIEYRDFNGKGHILTFRGRSDPIHTPGTHGVIEFRNLHQTDQEKA